MKFIKIYLKISHIFLNKTFKVKFHFNILFNFNFYLHYIMQNFVLSKRF